MSKLLILALLSDLLTPTLIWKGWLPAEARWVSTAALALILAIAYSRVISSKRVPPVIWLIGGLTATGAASALLNGQDITSTAWGWWLMFRYPLVGICVYLEPGSSAGAADRLRRSCYILIPFEVAVQILQYLTGQAPGDSLAGTLGPQGTGRLVMLVTWVLALALGDWIARGRVFPLVTLFVLGMVASALGEMKMFPFIVGATGIMAALMYGLRKHRLRQVLVFAPILIGVVAVFPRLYNEIVPESRIQPFYAYFDPDTLDRYLGGVRTSGDHYDVSRNYGLQYSWQRINANSWTLLLGEGLGARGESKTLGTAGSAIRGGDLGLYTGSSLAVIMGELGLLGLFAVTAFILATSAKLWFSPNFEQSFGVSSLRYAVLLYTLTWPVWLWYNSSWQEPIPALIYWISLGYVMQIGQRESVEATVEPPFAMYRPGSSWEETRWLNQAPL